MDYSSYIEVIIEFVSLIFAVVVFVITSIAEKKATEEQTRKETVRATLKDFTELRRTHNIALLTNMKSDEAHKTIKC